MLLTMFFWGISFVASKLVLTQITPLTYMGVRFAAASLLLAIVMGFRGRPRFTRGTHGLIALTALAEPVAYFLFESFGLRLITATTASLIIATIPLAVMVLAAIFLGEPIRRRGLVAVVVSIAGIILLVVGDPASSGAGADHVLGILLVVGAVFSAAFYITLARNLTQRHDPVNLTVVQTWWGAGVFVVLWSAQTSAARSLTPLTTTGWGALTFLVVGATVGAFLLYNWALRHEEAGRASLYINAIPVITALTGWLILGERLALLQWIGGIMVLISVRISSGGHGSADLPEVAETVPPEA